jgi:hypothetical protein
MNLKGTVTAETNPSRSMCRAYHSATDSTKEEHMLQKSDADTANEEHMLQKYFVQAKPVPTLYIEISENSSLSMESDEYIVKNIEIFIEHGQVSNARLLLSSIPFGISSKLDNWRRVLAIPKVKPEKVATGVDIKQNSSWLLNNSKNFKGKWVAIKNGILLGSHESRIELHRQLTFSNKVIGATFFKVGKD